MSKGKHAIRKNINICQLPRYSRPQRLYLYNVYAKYTKPINIWSHNINLAKELMNKEDKLLQK